ncbi:MAG TPA: hypothetical protein ENI42_01280 [Thermoplasmatales archaeon]|nr:hypothetical protein [Thermoplasmatales archaeon]
MRRRSVFVCFFVVLFLVTPVVSAVETPGVLGDSKVSDGLRVGGLDDPSDWFALLRAVAFMCFAAAGIGEFRWGYNNLDTPMEWVSFLFAFYQVFLVFYYLADAFDVVDTDKNGE